MDRRALPLVLLAALLVAATFWIWPRAAAWHHGRVIFELAVRHRDRNGPAWPEADTRRLWKSIGWFLRNRRDDLRTRILDALADPDAGRREAALVLTSELELYQDKIYGPTEFPGPGGDPTAQELREFRVHKFVGTHPDAFAAAVRGTSERAQFIFLRLARVNESASHGRSVENIITGTASDGLRLHAIRALLWGEGAPSTFDVLRRIRQNPNPCLRLGALAALACYSDPEGTREFVAAISHPPADASGEALATPIAWLGFTFSSLQEWSGYTYDYFWHDWSSTMGLPCDLRAPWEAWLDLREREGFAPEPQKARDAAFEEEEKRLGFR